MVRLTTGLELALRTGDPKGALEQLRPLRASCLAALGWSADEYAPDYAAERASGVVRDCARLGIELPAVELLDLMPEWSALLR